MSSSCRNQECSFGMFLPMNMRKIRLNTFYFLLEKCGLRSRWHGFFSRKNLYHLREGMYSNYVDIGNYRCFRSVIMWEKNSFHAEFSSQYGCREGSLNRPEEPIEGHFPEKHRTYGYRIIELNLFSEYPESNREVIDGSFFLQISGRKVYRYASSSWEDISRILDSTPYAFSTFLNGCIAKANNRKLSHSSYNINFYFDELTGDSIDGCRKELLHIFPRIMGKVKKYSW